MRIGIDAHGLGGHSMGLGNETYFGNLIAGLLEIDRQNEYHIFVNHPEAARELVRGRPNARLVSLFPHTQWLQRPVSMPAYANRHKLDLVHCPFIRPPFTNAKTVITVHDANYEFFPQDFTFVERWRMKLLVPPSCRRADLIFTVSEFTRQELHHVYQIPLEKIVVTHNAADHLPAWQTDAGGQPPRKFDLPEHYVFFAGMIQPKKNLPRLVRAFDLIKSRADLPHHLVIAGKWGWGNDELKRVLESLEHRDSVHFLGYLYPKEVASVMSGADMFAFPSLYESFGIPPMEAQRQGVAALVSNTTCFPEIYGDSVMYCDPYDVQSIADAMQSLLVDVGLRSELVKRSESWARRFSWRKTAQVALNAYEQLLQENAGQRALAAAQGAR
jgi:glycosyltransferase involved in cell wall biosynthesis